MGVRADDDEFGDGLEIGDSDGDTNRDGDRDGVAYEIGDDEEEEEASRIFRNAGVEQNNDIVARFSNLFMYIVLVRCGSEMPMHQFDLPAGSGVGGDMFSQLITSVLPSEVTSVVASAGVPDGRGAAS